MLTTMKILSLNVRFGVRSDVKMVPTFLRCFPNVERLHIMVFVTNSCSTYISIDLLPVIYFKSIIICHCDSSLYGRFGFVHCNVMDYSDAS